MNRPDPHETYAELAAGHALSSLEPADEQAFLAHLPSCTRCTTDLREHRSTLAHLAYAADDAEPPAALLEGIRADMLASGRERGLVPVEPPVPATILDLDRARTRRIGRRSGQVAGIAAAAAMVLSLGIWNTSLRADREAQDALASRVSAAIHDLGDRDARPVPLRTLEGRTVAVALVSGDAVSVLVDGLPANPDGTTYVLWGRVGSALLPVGAFDVTGSAMDAVHGLKLTNANRDLTEFMVTREKGRRAPAVPASPVVASGQA